MSRLNNPEEMKLVKDFNQLTEKEKENYIVGFKLGYNLYQMKDNKNIMYFVNKIYNYYETVNKPEESQEKSQEKGINDLLLTNFENVLRKCNQDQKKVLISSLETYIQNEKKYNESVDRLNELKKLISKNTVLNQHRNVFNAQSKFIQLAEINKTNLENSY